MRVTSGEQQTEVELGRRVKEKRWEEHNREFVKVGEDWQKTNGQIWQSMIGHCRFQSYWLVVRGVVGWGGVVMNKKQKKKKKRVERKMSS